MPTKISRKLLDRIVFSATTDAIDPEDRVRQIVDFRVDGASGKFELWGHKLRSKAATDRTRWVILKFPGTGGRAERTTVHPAGFFPEGSVEGVWALNPPGYGNSDGRPSLDTMPSVIQAAVDSVRSISPKARLLVTGNSLGCIWALHAGAYCGADALLLRNPFPLKELITGRWRYNWWNFGAARIIANNVPVELDAIRNAGLCRCPCMVVQSELDRLIPAGYQKMVMDGLACPSKTLVIPGADHGDPVPDGLIGKYRELFQRLIVMDYNPA